MKWSEPSRSRLEAALVATALLGVALMAFAVPGSAPARAAPPLPPLSTGVLVNYTLYGSALTGWGFASGNITNPGPHLFVNYGDTVQLTLISVDLSSVQHNWFIDYDNSSAPNGAEPSSPLFSSTNSKVWNFTADRIGTFVYRCEVHPSTMTGLITISAPTHYTLYGSVTPPLVGWGLNATNISAPGPTLLVAAGTNVTLTLYSADGVGHTWFIDYDNSSSVNGAEVQSSEFGGPGNSNTTNYSFVPERTGNFTYRCGIHLAQMWGMIIIVGKGSGGSAAFPIGLIPGIMLVVISGVLILAAVYQVRASRAARLKK